MTDYISYVITDAGRNLIAQVIDGETLTFKRIAIGDGFDYNVAEFQNKTELVNEVISIDNLTKEDVDSADVIIKGSFSQQDLEEEFYYREAGLYVVDPDDENEEILFAYGNKNDKAELIVPSTASYVVTKDINFYITVGRTANVNIYISDEAAATVINFTENDWIYDSASDIYSIDFGEISESIKIFKKIGSTKIDVPLATIRRTGNNETTIECLSAFNGCIVCI